VFPPLRRQNNVSKRGIYILPQFADTECSERPLQEAKSLAVNSKSGERHNLLIVVSAQRPQLQRRCSCSQTQPTHGELAATTPQNRYGGFQSDFSVCRLQITFKTADAL